MELSILICHIPSRAEMFQDLMGSLRSQVERLGKGDMVEILYSVNLNVTTGEKRNHLLERAKGKYTVFIDDDDEVPEYYVEEILMAAKQDPDCMAINGTMTTNGQNEKRWFIAIENPYKAEMMDGYEVYLRYPNHITPMKREYALQVMFPEVSNHEDYDFATRLHNMGLLKTQVVIDRPMYMYKYLTYNKSY